MSFDGYRPMRTPERESQLREIVRVVLDERAQGVTLTDSQLSRRFPDAWPELADELQKLQQINLALDRLEDSRWVRAIRRIGRDDAGEAVSTGSTGGLGHAPTDSPLPDQIGRFRVRRVLGQGGFGSVFLAWDSELARYVAIKVPHRHRLAEPGDVEAFVDEARVLASLDHPAIVPVYDVGRTPDGGCFVVSKWISGTSLAERLRTARLRPREAARIVQCVADALAFAHERGIVHRDVKPANILLDDEGQPHVVDFGLAARKNELIDSFTAAGTPAYMSPELARGEAHRVDGRSDVFSLGVVLYELLTGRRPFDAIQPDELVHQIVQTDPLPLRHWEAAIPAELERICLKSLGKRAADRYPSAREMSDDMERCLADVSNWDGASAGESERANSGLLYSTCRIVPKGLRPFDANDAAYFPDLLPGPRDRYGIPESIRQWKTRIENFDPDESFTVGLIYGPSGCGKTSFVRAGLLPRLDSRVQVVYLEASAEETEERLLARLARKFPDVASSNDLAGFISHLRRERKLFQRGKLLLVIDQFEQWLHGREDAQRRSLAAALRQCDGERVQCLLLIRDDFWLGISRFMADLEIDLSQGTNTALVDLFDGRHARMVLVEFGRAYGRLSVRREPCAAETAFLDQAIASLAEEGRVISVQLSLFAEMVKDKPWTLATLDEVGGAAGLGVSFLEETFCSRTANPQNRAHERAARAVLESLLPDAGSRIKGHVRSYLELLDVSGYGTNPRAFKELMRILDAETRLLTPADASLTVSREGTGIPEVRYYQVTHDYLVPSLRSWLTKKRKLTRRGRAELRLAERAGFWNVRPEARQLPSAWEWLTIQLLTRSAQWTAPQSRMMRVAGRRHALTAAGVLAALLVIVLAGTELSSLAQRSLVWFRTTTAPVWLAFGREESIWPLLQHSADPTQRTRLIHSLSSLFVDPEQLVRRQFEHEDLSVRRAMILAAGELAGDPGMDASASTRRRLETTQNLVGQLVELYVNSTDPGIHAAAEWSLRRHDQHEAIARSSIGLFAIRSLGDRQWFLTQQGHTMVVIPGPAQFSMGSPADEDGRHADETLHSVTIRRSFSIASKETTIEQFQRFRRDRPLRLAVPDHGSEISLAAPQTSVSWYDAAAYCNWLSEQEGLPRSQWCYEPNANGNYAAGMKVAPDATELRGYRLPTEAEWEYACRAGATTAWYFGHVESYLDKYQISSTGQAQTFPLQVGLRKPNDFGLFDMLGNAAEWCLDRYSRENALDDQELSQPGTAEVTDKSAYGVRGGSCLNGPLDARCASRRELPAGDVRNDIGFRVARSYP